MKTTVTVLAENTARGRGILGEHGLSFWIDTGSHRVLFDTGQGRVLLPNAQTLGIDLGRADAIVFSHGHYDHVGGSVLALDAAPEAPVYFHPCARESKFQEKNGLVEPVSIPFWSETGLDAYAARLVPGSGPFVLPGGIRATGEIPRQTNFEDVGGAFYLDEALTEPDPIRDDQALFFECEAGVVVILGCAHAGLVNTLDYVAQLTGEERVHAVLGGAHLVHASEERIARTVAALREREVAYLGLGHCTGDEALAALRQAFPGRNHPCHAGSVHVF